MIDDTYRRLAQRLDSLPNGYPATESGVELRLLRKLFPPEEAALAASMGASRESPSEIARRVGVDPETARETLSGMAERGLIRAGEYEGELGFGLVPFSMDFYAAPLRRMDAEFAELIEQHYQETDGLSGILRAPSVHRVIPVEESVPIHLEVYPYERASEMLEGAKSWGVRDCICRVQQHLVGRDCGHPVKVCLVFAPVEGAFDRSEIDRALTKDEALGILRESRDAGLVHSTSNYREGNNYICSCCTCSCGILRSVAEFGHLTAVARSEFRSVVDTDMCIGCGDCVESCQFGALEVPDALCVPDPVRCVGCGLCVTVCPTGALQLERRPEEESILPPENHREWEIQRA